MSFRGPELNLSADAGRHISEYSSKIDQLRDFWEGGIIKVKTQDKLIFVNASIYEEATKFLGDGISSIQLSNGLLATQDDLSLITIAWEQMINPNSLKRFFLSWSQTELEKLFDAIQRLEDCQDDFDECKDKLSALGCPDNIMDTCIQVLILAKPIGYKIKNETAADIVDNFSEIVGN